jgi:serine/threonine protein kinase
MPFTVSINEARKLIPEFTFLKALTQSAQKAAFHVQDNNKKDLCLKIISPTTEMDRLQREIKALREIVHSGVARFVEYEFSSKNGLDRHFLIEEFVAGADLDLSSGTPWPLKRVSDFFGELAQGLGAIHAKQIVHRDLKPSNIRVTPAGKPVIIDFGLARHLNMPDLTRTVLGAGLGTPLYFAPEQFRGTKRDIDERTDVFAFGVILHTAAVGAHPFYDGTQDLQGLEVAVCESKDYLNEAAFKQLPDKLQTLIKWLLGKNRCDRPRCQQVADALARIAQEVK